MSYTEILPLIEFLWFVGPTKVAGKTLRIRRSRKQRVIIAYQIISGAQSQTSIRISRGTGSFRVASQGLSRQFLKAQFRRRFS